jgi:ABC-type nickel/cobalt efflux system permease component RcnA
MAQSMSNSGASERGARIFGFPLEGFSLFQSLLLAFASAFLTFFSTTCASIFALLAWNVVGGHTVNYADTYLYVGFPAGVLVLVVALPLFLALWIRAKARK